MGCVFLLCMIRTSDGVHDGSERGVFSKGCGELTGGFDADMSVPGPPPDVWVTVGIVFVSSRELLDTQEVFVGHADGFRYLGPLWRRWAIY